CAHFFGAFSGDLDGCFWSPLEPGGFHLDFALFLFDQLGYFLVVPGEHDRDELELELIDHGLEELGDAQGEDGEAAWSVWCSRDNFGTLQLALEERKVEVKSSGFQWTPKTTVEVSAEGAEEVSALIDRLEDDDDVQKVFSNAQWPD
ncbi:MAG: YebC/PmpR family DNA-binding transcriptional regulator, partial [Myxococcota bacterium]